jgi:hypothetical protein
LAACLLASSLALQQFSSVAVYWRSRSWLPVATLSLLCCGTQEASVIEALHDGVEGCSQRQRSTGLDVCSEKEHWACVHETFRQLSFRGSDITRGLVQKVVKRHVKNCPGCRIERVSNKFQTRDLGDARAARLGAEKPSEDVELAFSVQRFDVFE